MLRRLKPLLLAAALVAVLAVGWLAMGWWGGTDLDEETSFIVKSGSSLTSVAQELEDDRFISSADAFLLRAKIFGGGDPIQAGEFAFPAGVSPSGILDILQHAQPIQRFVTIPEGMPSIMVQERLMATPLLTGSVDVPAEGSVLPGTYAFERGQPRAEVLQRMQAEMARTLDELWAKRSGDIAVSNPREAVILASIVEKETGVPEERRMVAGLYSNRVRTGMMLQADPTIIYPITKGKPLGRRIRQSEISAINDYNTYSMVGLPKGPITNPGRESIAAVLNPADTEAIYMVADGSGGHAFAATLAEHNANVAKWFALRRARGEM